MSRPTPHRPALFATLLSLACGAQAQADLPTVAVKAARLPEVKERREAPRSEIIVSAQEIEKYNYSTVGELLKTLPGMTFSGPPGQIKDIRMRGMDKGYTEILINGEPALGGTKELQMQTDRIPMDLVERVEVLRSPLAGESGGGIGGSINIVLKQSAADINAFQFSVHRNGSHDGQQASMTLGRQSERFDWMLSASAIKRVEPKTKSKDEIKYKADGSLDARSGELETELVRIQELGLAPKLVWKLGQGQDLALDGFFSRADEDKTKTKPRYSGGTLGAPAATFAGAENEQEDKRRELGRLALQWQRPLAGGELKLRASHSQASERRPKTKWTYDAKNLLTATALEDVDIDERRQALSASLSRPWGRHHQIEAGLSLARSERDSDKQTVNIDPKKGESSKPPGRGDAYALQEERLAVWLSDRWQLRPAHQLSLGARAESLRTTGRDQLGAERSGHHSLLNPGAHYLWKIRPHWQLRASLAATTKTPKLEDLSPVVESADGTAAKPDKGGNPGLKPERALGFDLGLEHYLKGDRGVIALNAFHKDIRELVQRRQVQEGGRWIERPFNMPGHSKVYGLELDWNLGLHALGLPSLSLRGNISRLGSRVTDDKTGQTTRAKDQLPWAANFGADWRINPAWRTGFNLNVLAARPQTVLNENYESASRLLDLYAAWQVQPHVFVRLAANNVLNTEKKKLKRSHAANGALSSLTRELETGVRSVSLSVETLF